MSAATKRKIVTNEALNDYPEPDASRKQEITQIIRPCGNNLHEVRTCSGETYLVSMPTKFRKNLWLKRGDYCIIEPIEEGDRVRGEIINVIITKDQIKHLKQINKWPFDTGATLRENESGGCSSATLSSRRETSETPYVGIDLPPSSPETSSSEDEETDAGDELLTPVLP